MAPVFLAVGISLYFGGFLNLDKWSIIVTGFILFFIQFFLKEKFPIFRMIILSIFIMIAGYGVTEFRVWSVATKTLEKEIKPTFVKGTVHYVRQYEDGKIRLTLKDTEIRNIKELDLVNIRINKYDELPCPGDKVSVRAGLMPPPGPSMPGDYDYARQVWFQNISAVGYGVSALELLEKNEGFSSSVNKFRQNIAAKIQNHIEGETGALAAALITGIRGTMPNELIESMRDAGLAHLLAISGLHMGLLSGVVFFATRFVLSKFPALALKYPIKKWSAIIASFAGFGYLFLSGASIPTIRAFIMVFIVFIGVLTDRKAISLRLVAIAASGILVYSPEALIGVSFQMSFAAVLALVMAYESFGNDFLNKVKGEGGIIRKGVYLLIASLMTSLIAEAAIAPFALYHFNKVALYGLLANLIAMPVMGSWVMPWIVVALVLMPLGLEELALIPMSWGLNIIIEVAYFVSSLPGSTISLPAIDLKALICLVLGLLWLGVWRLKWRFAGIPMIVIGVYFTVMTKQPDILIDNAGKTIGIKNPEGQIILSRLNGSRIVKDRWRQRYGQETMPKRWNYESFIPENAGDRELSCDRLSCLYRPKSANHLLISFVRNERALIEDCGVANMIISLVPVNTDCSSEITIDRWDFYHNGGHAIWFPGGIGDEIKIKNVRESRGSFPWTQIKSF